MRGKNTEGSCSSFRSFNLQFPLFFFKKFSLNINMWRKSRGCWCYGKNRRHFEHGLPYVERQRLRVVCETLLPPSPRGCVSSEVCLCSSTRGTQHVQYTIQTARTKPQIDISIFFIYLFFSLHRALGEQMRKHFQFQSSAVGQQPQLLGNKQAAPGATVCPCSYLCV